MGATQICTHRPKILNPLRLVYSTLMQLLPYSRIFKEDTFWDTPKWSKLVDRCTAYTAYITCGKPNTKPSPIWPWVVKFILQNREVFCSRFTLSPYRIPWLGGGVQPVHQGAIAPAWGQIHLRHLGFSAGLWKILTWWDFLWWDMMGRNMGISLGNMGTQWNK